MTNEFAIGVAMFVAAIVGVICIYKLVIKGTSKKQRFIAKAERNGCVTEGHFVDYRVSKGTEKGGSSTFRNDIYIVKYEYVVEGRSYYKKLPFLAAGVVAPRYPYQITVFYDHHNPSKAVSQQEATKSKQVRGGCLMSILFTALTIGIVYRLLLSL